MFTLIKWRDGRLPPPGSSLGHCCCVCEGLGHTLRGEGLFRSGAVPWGAELRLCCAIPGALNSCRTGLQTFMKQHYKGV